MNVYFHMGIFEMSFIFYVKKHHILDIQNRFKLKSILDIENLSDNSEYMLYYIKHWSLRTVEIVLVGENLNEPLQCCNKRYMPMIQDLPDYLINTYPIHFEQP